MPPPPPPPVFAPPPPLEERKEPKADRLHLFASYTLGFGKVDTVQQRFIPSLSTRPQNLLGQSQVSVSTFIVGGRFDVTPAFGVGARLPFSYGALGNITNDAGRAILFGNIELFATLQKKLSESLGIFGSLAVNLPSSLGTELPRTQAELSAFPADTFNRAEANRFSLNQAAAAMFGYEQDQLFWSKRFGITPAIEARWSQDKLHFEPFVKLPNLIDTHSSSVEPYRLEVVFGAAGGYRALPWLDLGLRAWGSAAIARRGASPVGAGVLSPEVKFVFGERNPTTIFVAAVLPFVGSNVDPYYFGALRAGVSGSF